MRDPVLAPLSAGVEVDPPEQDAAEHGHEKGRPGVVRPGHLRERGAGDEQRLAERDDDEEPTAFRQVPAVRRSSHWCSIDRDRAPRSIATVQRTRSRARRARARNATNPRRTHRRSRRRRTYRARPAMRWKVPQQGVRAAPHRPQEEQGPTDLHERIRAREVEAKLVERMRDRHRHHQTRDQQHQQAGPHRDALGVEPVGHPGGVDPDPPDARAAAG